MFIPTMSSTIRDPKLILITDPNGWGGGAPGGRQHGYYNNRTVDDQILQIAGEL